MLKHCEYLQHVDVSKLTDQWKANKHKKPVRGAILLNKDLTKVRLLRVVCFVYLGVVCVSTRISCFDILGVSERQTGARRIGHRCCRERGTATVHSIDVALQCCSKGVRRSGFRHQRSDKGRSIH